ncbi:MAG: membrane dipeptidase [Vicinamibacterales bacterium]|nr:membrane dipeptidase [Vicinamibacterales bacterium]
MSQPIIFDVHLDLSMNALEWNRDLRWTVQDIRDSERDLSDRPDRGRGTVSFEAMQRGRVGLCAATLIARYVERGSTIPGWHSQEQAWAQTQGQLAWYRAMEDAGAMVAISSAGDLERHLELLQTGADVPLGYVLSLEGADSLVTLQHLERAYAAGLRAIGPAHYGPGVYAQGTNATGGVGEKGRTLLREMERLNIILDATHLCEESFWESLHLYRGPVWASHNNCRVFVPHNRQFSDEQVQALIARDAVIGVAFDAWMLVPGWVRGTSTPENMGVTLKQVVDNIDHICQVAGNSRHAAIGSDLDGAFGTEQCPADVDTIADLQKIPGLLAQRGYTSEDIENVCSGNVIRFLRHAWR